MPSDKSLRFLPAISAIVVGVLGIVLYHINIDCAPDQMVTCTPHKPYFRFLEGPLPFEELAGRFTWSATILLFVSIAIGTAALGAYVIWNEWAWGRVTSWVARALIIVLVIGVAGVGVWAVSPAVGPFILEEPFLKPTVYRQLAVREVLGVFDGFAVAVTVLVVFAACATLTSPFGVPETDQTKRQEQITVEAAVLARLLRRLRTLLYAAALVMVAGVTEVSALYTWATTMVVADSADESPNEGKPPSAGEAAAPEILPRPAEYLPKREAVAASVSLLTGAFYSVLLSAIFLPAFWVIRLRARTLADAAKEAEPEDKRKEWLEQHGLSAPLPKQLGAVVGVLGPLLIASPVSELFKGLTE